MLIHSRLRNNILGPEQSAARSGAAFPLKPLFETESGFAAEFGEHRRIESGRKGLLNAESRVSHLALKLPSVPPESLGLVRAAGLMLLVVFAIKAALVPLGYWLPGAYAAAPAPATVLFALMTKVGVYAVLRVGSVAFGADGGALAGLGQDVLFVLGVLTIGVAAIGCWAARRLGSLAAFLVMLYEEVVGTGFYKEEKEQSYVRYEE